MKYFIRILIFIMAAGFCFGATFVENIKKTNGVAAVIKEAVYLNGKKKEKTYTVKLQFPDIVRKEVVSNGASKGEIYLYNGNKKTIYYPMLKQKVEKELDGEENYFMSVLKEIKSVGNTSKKQLKQGVYKYIFDNGEIISIEDTKNKVKIEFGKYEKNYPGIIKIKEGETVISEINIEKIEFDYEMQPEDLKL